MVLGVLRESRNNPQGKKTSDGILDLQTKCFLYGGILPSADMSSSPWKLRIYNIYTTLVFTSYAPSLCAQFYSLFETDTITESTDTIFTIIAALLHVSISCYLLTKRKELRYLVLRTEDSFAEHTSKLPLEMKHALIMTEARKKIRLYSWIFIISIIITGSLWIGLPYIFWHVHNANIENKNGEGGNKTHWEHLCYRMWLPPSAMDHPFYHFIWMYQVILIVILLADNAGYNSMYYTVTLYTAAHFKVLATLLEDTDQYIKSSDYTRNSERSENDSLLEDRTGSVKEVVLKHCRQNSRENIRNKFLPLEEYHALNPEPIKSIPLAEDYLVRCVKYHQAILQ
jgi:hypothetical protein